MDKHDLKGAAKLAKKELNLTAQQLFDAPDGFENTLVKEFVDGLLACALLEAATMVTESLEEEDG